MDFEFTYKNIYEYRLLEQLFFKIADDRKKYRYNRGKGKKTIRGIVCTKAEGLQIQIEYDFYKELWNEECDFFFRSFVQKHSIFDKSKKKGERKVSIEELLRMQHLMSGMQDKQMATMIEGSEKSV